MSVYRVQLDDVRERAYAALLGVAIGDALGATLEFMTPKEIQAQYGVLTEIRGGGWLHLPKGAVTDDTEMTLCIARSLTEVGWSPQNIAAKFAEWLKLRPRDVGATCRRGIRRYINDGSLSAPPCDADAGNGAVMRMAPIAIASLADRALLENWALGQARITHHHPLSDTACILVGRLVHLACVGHAKPRLRALADATVERWPEFRFFPHFGVCSAYVVDTMKTVLYHLFATNSFADCLIATVNAGGDSDTSGAIVGAIAGAYYGRDAIPERWIAALKPGLVSELERLATALVSLSPLANGGPVPTFAQLFE